MEVAHDSIFGGHLGVKETKDRIQTNFYWPGMLNDVKEFCRSCDVCQKTVDKETVARAPLVEMPLIDTPFKRVAVGLVGPITPASKRGIDISLPWWITPRGIPKLCLSKMSTLKL